MFSGIIEQTGLVKKVKKEGTNVTLSIQTEFDEAIYIDQSIAHNGVCLTVVKIEDDTFDVTMVAETLDRSNFKEVSVGSKINLERAMRPNQRLDGHIVQGHVDETAIVKSIEEVEGSWYFEFEFNPENENLLVDKGSVCINGVSLTVVSPTSNTFKVAIIPYTYEHTNFSNLQIGDTVNIEFDILGKYVAKSMALYRS